MTDLAKRLSEFGRPIVRIRAGAEAECLRSCVCYPTGWLKTLERIDALDASVMVPGHGEPLRDKELLHATMAVFRELLRQGKDAKSRGVEVDKAKDAIMPSLHELMLKITHGDSGLNQAFRVQLVDWYLHRVYDELDGPLTDDIAPIPKA